jgi:amidase
MAATEAQDALAASGKQAPPEELFEPMTLGLIAHFRAAPAGALITAMGRMQQASAAYIGLYSDLDVILTPVVATPAPPLGEYSPSLPYEEVFARLTDYVGYTPLMNAAGTPAISLPMAWSSDGLPIGAHFAGPPGSEQRLLELAFELEESFERRRPLVWAG